MNKVDYGNWVSAFMMKTIIVLSSIFFILLVLSVLFLKIQVISIILAIIFVVSLAFTIYMKICRNLLDFEKGGLMGKIHQDVVKHLEWDGEGELLDIGCGSGALSICCAKRFSNSKVTGIDYWGTEWSFAKEQCENNAMLEGVSSRTNFVKGDAANLDFESESFDAAISNFVFHEVRSAKDKRDVVREALRILKKGGSFCFQDLFSQKKLYGDMNEFCEELKQSGIEEIHYIANTENNEFIPSYIKLPWMIKNVGMIYGKK